LIFNNARHQSGSTGVVPRKGSLHGWKDQSLLAGSTQQSAFSQAIFSADC
jgi:hypothetical protein